MSEHKHSVPEPLWEEDTHRQIVAKAIALMEAYKGSNRYVGQFCTIFHANKEFRDNLYQGLANADNCSPWNDNNWESHFYNPLNKQNYRKRTFITARSEARRWFKFAENYAARILFHRSTGNPAPLFKYAGDLLGLSLHFLTDLTQPMHAANFTNVWGEEGSLIPKPDLRHAGLEIYTDNAVGRGLLKDLAPLEDKHLSPFKNDDVGDFIETVAVESKSLFDNNLLAVLRKKVLKYGGIEFLPEGYWRAAEADPIIKQTVLAAPYRVANYLANWVRLADKKRPYSSLRWYRIKEPTKNMVADLSDGAGQWIYRNNWLNVDHQKFYLMFNADGSVCIGCKKDNMNRLWSAEESWGGWIGQNIGIAKKTRFCLHSYDDNQVFIQGPLKGEAVHVNTGKANDEWHGWFLEFSAAYDDNQRFVLEDLGPLSNEDVAKIKTTYPDFQKYTWAGTDSDVNEQQILSDSAANPKPHCFEMPTDTPDLGHTCAPPHPQASRGEVS